MDYKEEDWYKRLVKCVKAGEAVSPLDVGKLLSVLNESQNKSYPQIQCIECGDPHDGLEQLSPQGFYKCRDCCYKELDK